jgi:hypothetical protein
VLGHQGSVSIGPQIPVRHTVDDVSSLLLPPVVVALLVDRGLCLLERLAQLAGELGGALQVLLGVGAELLAARPPTQCSGTAARILTDYADLKLSSKFQAPVV